MKRFLLILFVCASATAQVLQEQHPNSARGFAPEKMYDFSAVDSVNVFNGNLTLRIPIGPKLAVNGMLPYQLALTYNSNCWDYIYWVIQVSGGTERALQAAPSRRANAGIGWIFALGRILPTDPNDPHDGRVATYESSDGADHPLYPSLHGGSPDGYYYSRDSSYIRVTAGSPSWLIELPDGTKQTVAYLDTAFSPWVPAATQSSTTTIDRRLTQMTDRFENSVSITYETTSTYQEIWTITGAGPTSIKAYFKTPAQLSLQTSYDKVLLDHVEAPKAGGGTMSYQFAYDVFSTPPGAGDTFAPNTPISVAFLRDITFPTGEKYSFTYDTTSIVHPAVVNTMALPTGGTVAWSWDAAVFPDGSWQKDGTGANAGAGITPVPMPSAVTSRQFGGGTWTYLQHLSDPESCSTNLSGISECPLATPNCYGGTRQKSVSVTAPDNTTTISYFSLYQKGNSPHRDSCSIPEGWLTAEYGLPLTRYCPNSSTCASTTVAGLKRFLSKELRTGFVGWPSTNIWDGKGRVPASTGEKRFRSTWVTYDVDQYSDTGSLTPIPSQNPRTSSTMTVFEDDSNCGGLCYSGSNSYSFDGYGHFRQESSFGNLSDVFRTTFTNYDGTLDDQAHWVLGTSTEGCALDESQQRTSPISSCSDLSGAPVTQTKYDRARGALLARRIQCVHCDATNGSRDLLAVFERDTADHGHISREKYFGGDVHPLPASTDPFSTTLSPEYEVDHSYAFSSGIMTAVSASYANMTFKIEDSDFDPASGFITASRDTAGVGTTYEYDANNRLQAIKPTGEAWTELTYTIAGNGVPPSVAVKQRPYNTSASAAPLTDKRIVFDSWGRPIRQSHLGPNEWSAFETSYDGLGRVQTVSEPESTGSGPPSSSLTAAYKTSYEYDELGHQKKITASDGSMSTFTFEGERKKTRTANIWDGTTDVAVDSVETYDNLGRLATVTEKSGPTTAASKSGAAVTTTYAYDSTNHLTFVSANGSGAVQNRFFDYDSRGFLRWESQPESGMVDYTYDSRGHVSTRSQSDANSPFDLKYTYDAAERLSFIQARNPVQTSMFRTIKEFGYGTDNNGNDLRKGKLISAIRHNYYDDAVPAGDFLDPAEYVVKDEYKYVDAAGRRTDRTTTITAVGNGFTTQAQQFTTSQTYDDLGLPKTIGYPLCLDCGQPPLDPVRTGMTRTYAAGRLTALSDFATSISYWPDGLRNVLGHANGIEDTQTVTSMPRPATIKFATYDRCVHPAFTTQPVSAPLPAGGGGVTLSVGVSGTAPFSYQWSDVTHFQSLATTPTITVNPTSDTSYQVTVTNPCGYEVSQVAKVTVSGCPLPSTGIINAVVQPDGSWILKPKPIMRQGATFSWVRLSDNQVVGASQTLPVASLPATTTYRLTITDECGSGSGTVTVTVPLPITTGLSATWSAQTGAIALVWPAIDGATQYVIERRYGGGAWAQVGTSTTNSFTDSSVASSTTYVYRVTSPNNGGRTDYDVATTMSFTAAVAGTKITMAATGSMLDAVNKVRAAAGWPAVTWTNILSANDPFPFAGGIISSRHILACRVRMNEALQALGVAVRPYTDPDPRNLTIKASYINEVEQRAQ